jgi:hypothetical protein
VNVLAAWWIKRDKSNTLPLLLALSLIHGLLYLVIIPPWQSPDEPYHLLSALLPGLAHDPTPGVTLDRVESEMVSSLVEFDFWDMVVHVPAARGQEEVYRYLPPGPDFTEDSKPRSFVHYLLFIGLRPVAHQEIIFQLYWARLLSVLTNLAIVTVAYATARLLFGDDPFGSVMLPLSIALLPEHSFILSGVSDGNPAELFASLAVYFWVWGSTRGWSWARIAGLGLFTILGVAAKPTALYIVPVLVIWGAIYCWRHMPGVTKLLFIPVVIAFAYGATLLSVGVRRHILFFQWAGGGSFQEQALQRQPILGRALFETFRGFWADLGWGSLVVSDTWAYILLFFSLLAALGLLKRLLAPARAGSEGPGKRVIFFLGVYVLVDVSLVSAEFLVVGVSLYDPRYLFGAIIPIMALLVIGWRELFPSNWRREGLALLASFFFLFDAVVLLDYAVPFFYPLWR